MRVSEKTFLNNNRKYQLYDCYISEAKKDIYFTSFFEAVEYMNVHNVDGCIYLYGKYNAFSMLVGSRCNGWGWQFKTLKYKLMYKRYLAKCKRGLLIDTTLSIICVGLMLAALYHIITRSFNLVLDSMYGVHDTITQSILNNQIGLIMFSCLVCIVFIMFMIVSFKDSIKDYKRMTK